MSFFNDWILRRVTIEDIDDYVDKWHNSDSSKSIPAYLGISREAYFKYCESVEELEKYLINQISSTTFNVGHLLSEVLPQRKLDIENGKNYGTRQPIWMIFNTRSYWVSGHSDFSPDHSLQNKGCDYGYYNSDLDSEDREFIFVQELLDELGLEDSYSVPSNYERVTQYYVSEYVAMFFTNEDAEDYLRYQSHNLTDPIKFVHYTGYRNAAMDYLFKE